jgi:hypothetical protein
MTPSDSDFDLISRLEAVRIVLNANRRVLDMFAALGNADWYERAELDQFLTPARLAA